MGICRIGDESRDYTHRPKEVYRLIFAMAENVEKIMRVESDIELGAAVIDGHADFSFADISAHGCQVELSGSKGEPHCAAMIRW